MRYHVLRRPAWWLSNLFRQSTAKLHLISLTIPRPFPVDLGPQRQGQHEVCRSNDDQEKGVPIVHPEYSIGPVKVTRSLCVGRPSMVGHKIKPEGFAPLGVDRVQLRTKIVPVCAETHDGHDACDVFAELWVPKVGS